MPATSTYSPTGNTLIDGILMGTKWATTTLTVSFPTSASYYGSRYGSGEPNHNFQALNATQQAWVKQVLADYSSVANLKFNFVTETSSTHGDIRYAMSDSPSTAWSYYPYTGATGGDAWFNNSTGWYDDPVMGNYAALTFLHETGHAVGLKHAHETSGRFPAEPSAYDSLEYTVMSYRSYVGQSTSAGYANADDSYPQTLMMLDIAAVQQLYGANYKTNAGDTTYAWDPGTGQTLVNGTSMGVTAGNKIFLTIWDGGGTDTYDFSHYTSGVTVDLQPGHWSIASTAQLADLGDGHTAVGSIANALLYQGNTASLIENAIGGSGNDTMTGNSANNQFTGGGGNDTIDGLDGTNTAVYSGNRSDYTWTTSNGVVTIVDNRGGSPDGTDTLTNIQYLKFADTTVATNVVTAPPVVVVNTAPVAANDSYSVARNGKLTVTAASGVLANDSDGNGDALTAALVTGVSRGTLTFNANGSFTYTAPRNYSGKVTFTYKDSDGQAASNTATVTITIGSSGRSGGGRGRGQETPDNMLAPADLVAQDSSGTGHQDWTGWSGARGHGTHGGELIDQIGGVLADLGSHHGGLPMGLLADHQDAGIDLVGIPGLGHAFYSEFHLG